MEDAFLLWIQETLRNPILNTIMISITRMADMGLIWIILALILMAKKETRKTGFCCACAMLLDLLVINVLLKNIIARPRPYDVIEELISLIGPQKDFSFPSGHTAIAFANLTVLILMKEKRFLIVIASVLTVLICFSRMYLGVHYPSDILGGIIFGILCGVAGCFIVNTLYARRAQSSIE